MDATPYLARVAQAISRQKLDAVLIGNAGAAMHGAPVTTIDFDFLIRETPGNRRKLAALTRDLEATLYQPFYPASKVLRLMKDDESLQVDFMTGVSGIRSFEGIRKRAVTMPAGAATVPVASLADIIKMKRAANRPQDLAVLALLEKTLEAIEAAQKEKGPSSSGSA